MESIQLEKNLYWVGVEDFDLRTFDIVMHTEYGTSYNSYVLKGSEKTALFETSKIGFFDEYLSHVQSIVDIDQIDYIVMNHTEPDHAGSLAKLLEMNPKITVVGTQVAMGFLKQIVNRDFPSLVVKEGDTLSLGDVTLHFMVLPNLHWPDSMYTYAPEIKALFTCDSFGSHFATKEVLRSKVTDEEGYKKATKYYFDNIIGPFKNPFMVNALNRTKDLDVRYICTGHGPVLDSHIEELRGWYEEWCKPTTFEKKTVIMPYVSAYGYTKELAQEIAKGIQEAGDIDVRMHDCVVESDLGSIVAEIHSADGVLLGSPTIVSEALPPIWTIATSLVAPMDKGKLASAFGSFGWSGEAVPHLVERLKQVHMKVLDGFKVRFKPSTEELESARAYGKEFGEILLGKEIPASK